MIMVLLFLSIFVFLLQKVGDADPIHSYLGANASQDQIERTRELLGLNRPLFAQYLSFLGSLLTGDFGISYSTKRPIIQDLSSRIPATLELMFWAVIFAVIIAVLLASVYVMKGKVGSVLKFLFFSAASAPSFLLATLGIVFLYGKLGWLPASGRTSFDDGAGATGFHVLDGLIAGDLTYASDALWHLALPALAAAIGPGVALARVLADGIIQGVHAPYARTARSLGEGENSIFFVYALRNASSPAISLLGVQTGMMLSSLVVVEQIFSWNGLGMYLSKAITSGDFPVVTAISMILGICYVLLNTIVDIALACVDPRVRLY
jgi:ABC-type dipeptide/oligopeptide/nickel transport system permease component